MRSSRAEATPLRLGRRGVRRRRPRRCWPWRRTSGCRTGRPPRDLPRVRSILQIARLHRPVEPRRPLRRPVALIDVSAGPSTRMDPLHADLRVVPDTLDPSGTVAPPAVSHRVCAICARSLAGRRPEAQSCSGRCRAALARLRRRDDLVARVRRAELALREAAEALASLKELAGLDATLELRSLHVVVGGGGR
jgi:predicted nucleic acid-binding Zn ribbon protein